MSFGKTIQRRNAAPLGVNRSERHSRTATAKPRHRNRRPPSARFRRKSKWRPIAIPKKIDIRPNAATSASLLKVNPVRSSHILPYAFIRYDVGQLMKFSCVIKSGPAIETIHSAGKFHELADVVFYEGVRQNV